MLTNIVRLFKSKVYRVKQKAAPNYVVGITCDLVSCKLGKYNLFIVDLLNFIKTARYTSNFDN